MLPFQSPAHILQDNAVRACVRAFFQALMGGREFCALLSLLRAAGPALPPGELPTLAAFSALAASFAPAPAAATGLAFLATVAGNVLSWMPRAYMRSSPQMPVVLEEAAHAPAQQAYEGGVAVNGCLSIRGGMVEVACQPLTRKVLSTAFCSGAAERGRQWRQAGEGAAVQGQGRRDARAKVRLEQA